MYERDWDDRQGGDCAGGDRRTNGTQGADPAAGHPCCCVGLVLSIVLFGRRGQPEPTKRLRLKTPEDFTWLLVAVLTLGSIFLG